MTNEDEKLDILGLVVIGKFSDGTCRQIYIHRNVADQIKQVFDKQKSFIIGENLDGIGIDTENKAKQ